MKSLSTIRRILKAGVLLSLMLLSVNGFALTNALKLKITAGSYSDETIVRFLDGATDNFDSNYDAYKLFSSNVNVPAIYTMAGSSTLSINAMNALTHDYFVDVYIKVPAAGNYTIVAEQLGAFSNTTGIILKDLVSGGYADLKNNPSFSFSTTDGTGNTGIKRFIIYFSTPVIIQYTEQPSCTKGGSTIIKKAGNTSWTYNLINRNGDILYSKNVFTETDTLTSLLPNEYTIRVNDNYVWEQDTIFEMQEPSVPRADFSYYTLTCTCTGEPIEFNNLSDNATSFTWKFDNTSTDSNLHCVRTFTDAGMHTIQLIAEGENGCADTSSLPLFIEFNQPTNTMETEDLNKVPVIITMRDGGIHIRNNSDKALQASIYNLQGQLIMGGVQLGSREERSLSVYPSISSGIYYVHIKSEQWNNIHKVVIAE